MEKLTTEGRDTSSIVWENLEEWVRWKVQEFIQTVLEEEVTELLGRGKSERRQVMDAPAIYRNGYGKERKLTLRLRSGQALEWWHYQGAPSQGQGPGAAR